MMRSEFIDILREVSPTHRDPSSEEYEAIELVYTYHPAIGDKKTIVKLWVDFGNTIIEDMKPRAEKIRDEALFPDAEGIRAISQIQEIRRLIAGAYEGRIYLDFNAWRFLNRLEDIVGKSH